MAFSSGEWTIPELCVWIQSRTKGAVNTMPPLARRSLKVAELICPGAHAARDEIIEKAQEGDLVVTCQNPHRDWGLPERISLSAEFWKSAELVDVSSWMAGGGPGICAARLINRAKPTEHLELLVSSAKAKELWPIVPQESSEAAPSKLGHGPVDAVPQNSVLLPEWQALVATLPKPPTLVEELAQWLRTDGSAHRNSPDKDIKAHFLAAKNKNVSDETIRKARASLGLADRPKRSQAR